MFEHIFIDMDGVLTDMVAPALTLHGRLDALDDWPLGSHDWGPAIGTDNDGFWEPVNRAGMAFWSELPAYPWTRDLWSLLGEHGPRSILSNPGPRIDCASGKVAWLHAHFGDGFRDYLLGHQKHLCAAPGRLLVDDLPGNVAAFREAGGAAILFPQPWNANHEHVADRLAFTRRELERLAPG